MEMELVIEPPTSSSNLVLGVGGWGGGVARKLAKLKLRLVQPTMSHVSHGVKISIDEKNNIMIP